MIDEIQEYLKEFKLNPPVFQVGEHSISDDLVLIPMTAQEPDPGNDPIKRLVNETVEQRFDLKSKRYRINKSEVETNVIRLIKGKLCKFVERNSETTKPRQTKLWRWMARGNMTPPVSEGFYLLYKYVANHCDQDNMNYTNPDTIHLKNVILILEAMQERYS